MSAIGRAPLLALATLLALAPALLGACALVSTAGPPTVGTIASCPPGMDDVSCRRIAVTALTAYRDQALAADGITVDRWASCALDGVAAIAPEAATGVECYAVSVLLANAGGRRIAEGQYQGGVPVNVESVVWSDSDGEIHAVTIVTEPR